MHVDSPRIITAQVSSELLERAHERAKLEDRSTASIVRRALSQYLDQQDLDVKQREPEPA